MDVIVFTRANDQVTRRNLPPGASDADFDAAIQRAIDSGKAVDTPKRVDSSTFPPDREFRDAWERVGGNVDINMPKARIIHGDRIAVAHAAEIALLKVDERKERLRGNTAKADAHATTGTALEALDLNVLATRIGNAANPAALSAIWPANVTRAD